MSKIDDLNKWLQIANIFAPMVLSVVKGGDKIAPFIPTVTKAIVDAEMTGAPGADKKAGVLATVSDGIAVANATGKVHLDPTEVIPIVSSSIDDVIEVINIVHQKAAPPTTPAPSQGS